MGTYRLILAYLVAYSHIADFRPAQINVGISSVVSFLLLSGFVMTALVEKYYFSKEKIGTFYIERIMRLAPQFLFYSVLTYICALLIGLRHNWMQSPPSFGSAFAQFLMVPLNFNRDFPNMLLPQAWSLGLEVMFYALVPFILIRKLRTLCVIISLPIFLAGYARLLDNDLWSYRLLPGTLFIFMLGSFIYTMSSSHGRVLVAITSTLSSLLFGLTWLSPSLATDVNRSVTIGLAVGAPIVYLLKSKSIEYPKSKWMPTMGDLSYGVFLNHNFVVGFLAVFSTLSFKNGLTNEIFYIIVIFSASFLLSIITFLLIENPISRKRRRMRDKFTSVRQRMI